MRFRVEFSDVADAEVQDIFLWILGRSPENAARWLKGLNDAVDELEAFPTRCPLAPENDAFESEIRQDRYGPYRLLFTLIDSTGDGVHDTVRILHVRHGARRLLTEE